MGVSQQKLKKSWFSIKSHFLIFSFPQKKSKKWTLKVMKSQDFCCLNPVAVTDLGESFGKSLFYSFIYLFLFFLGIYLGELYPSLLPVDLRLNRHFDLEKFSMNTNMIWQIKKMDNNMFSSYPSNFCSFWRLTISSQGV